MNAEDCVVVERAALDRAAADAHHAGWTRGLRRGASDAAGAVALSAATVGLVAGGDWWGAALGAALGWAALEVWYRRLPKEDKVSFACWDVATFAALLQESWGERQPGAGLSVPEGVDHG